MATLPKATNKRFNKVLFLEGILIASLIWLCSGCAQRAIPTWGHRSRRFDAERHPVPVKGMMADAGTSGSHINCMTCEGEQRRPVPR
uniref:Putative secreted protein n=1 Tax=Anopheles darlingi TaxID=43151 RepID=A0A2M4DI59_ANODA